MPYTMCLSLKMHVMVISPMVMLSYNYFPFFWSNSRIAYSLMIVRRTLKALKDSYFTSSTVVYSSDPFHSFSVSRWVSSRRKYAYDSKYLEKKCESLSPQPEHCWYLLSWIFWWIARKKRKHQWFNQRCTFNYFFNLFKLKHQNRTW